MSSIEVSSTKLESNIERLTLRPQRPPPPPPSTQFEPSIPIELKRTSFELETTFSSTEISDESNKDIKDNQSSFLYEFKDLFDSFDYKTVRNKILNRQMTTCPFTTVLWRIFLHCLSRDSSQWNQIIDASREHYDELVDRYLLDMKKIRENNGDAKDVNHPLSQEENSLWNQYYVYEELKENIYQDVIRTCQEISFFRQKHILDLLLYVLYVHSRHYGQTLPYRQGMHEILAVIVHLMYLESITVNEYSESNELMKKLYDPEYLAHDSFAIYEKIMEHLQPFYDFKSNNIVTRKNINMNVNKHMPFQRSHDVQVQMNDTVMRVNSIFELLQNYDLPLYEKLQALSIEPTVYGIRWLRLLFGREIPFGSIPRLWTVIFCYDECFKFVNYFFLALLMDIGRQFQKDGVLEYSCCLQYLMQPNVVSNVENIIHNALTLEKSSRTKQFQRSSSNLSSESTHNRSITTEIQKPVSPIQSFSQNPLMDSIKSNSTSRLISLAQTSKPVPSSPSIDSEMDVCPGKETRQRFDDNIQIQKYCAEFMNKFINRIQSHICELQAPNEEDVLIQLTGLKQIANILEGKLIFDDDSLQALLNYQYREKSIKNDINDTA
ncbi:unnamed protein product [Rotaria sp. Silwood2]|nr:unnamed protein product [Rotaria sp. Silwood2]